MLNLTDISESGCILLLLCIMIYQCMNTYYPIFCIICILYYIILNVIISYYITVLLPIPDTGKQVIHPNQVQPAHECFAPSPDTVKWAEELIEAFHKHKADGKVGGVGD